MIPALIAAGATLAGGLMNRSAQKEANETSERNALRNIEMQKQFAQEGIRWKVEDARQAGIHPLYALGAQTSSFSPVSVGAGADTSMGSALAAAGQDISRAFSATRTQGERQQAFSDTAASLSLTKMGLENELLATQVAKERAQIGPPMPGVVVSEKGKFEEREPIAALGKKLTTDPGTSPAKAWEDMFSDPGGYVAAAIHGERVLRDTHPAVAQFLREQAVRERESLFDYPEAVLKGRRKWFEFKWKRPEWTYPRSRFGDRFYW